MKAILFALLVTSATASMAAPGVAVQPLDVVKIHEAAVSARKAAGTLRQQGQEKKAKALEALADANDLLASVERLRSETDATFAKLAAATKETKALFDSLR